MRPGRERGRRPARGGPSRRDTAAAGDRKVPEPFHLPGFDPGTERPGGWHRGRTAAGREFRTPTLSGEEAGAIAGTVRAAALEARERRTLADVVSAVAAAAGELGDPSGSSGAAAVELLRSELGWTPELATETLKEMAATWTEDALWGVLRAELPDPAALETYVPASGRTPRRRRAVGPPLLFVVHAGNVPGVAVTAALRGLLVRSGVLCKAPRDEPGLLALFAGALAGADPLLGRSLATTWWPAEADLPAWETWVKRSGKVVVYGGEEAVRGVRARLPADGELLVYGPKVGVGVVLPDAVGDGEAAAGLARDVCAYEQQGCVSPRLVYVVGPAEPFAERLAAALAAEVERVPPPRLRPGEALAIRSARARAEFRGYGEPEGEAGRDSAVLGSSGDLAWTILLHHGPAAGAETLPRVVDLHPVPDLSRLLAALEPLEGRIQAVGYAGAEGLESLAEGCARLGVSRIAPFGRVAWPPPDWRHDGRPQLLPLLRWTDWEGG